MLVTTYKDGRARTGLLIGEANVQRYFRKRIRSVELWLDDLHIQCALEPDFWRGRPQIHDPRLSLWLEYKAGRRRGRQPMQLSMLPSGENAFIVRPESAPRDQAPAEITVLPTPAAELIDTPLSAA